MKELEEVNCDVRNVIDIQYCVTNCLNNINGEDNGSSNGSQTYESNDGICGGFLNDTTYAWLSYAYHLVVINVKTGVCTSSWTFKGKITCVSQFPAQCGELPLLLVGLDNGATRIKDSIGTLCIFDCTSSRVLRAIKFPAGIEQVSILFGGAEWEEFNSKKSDDLLMQMDGIACVVLRNLHHLMIDLQRSTWETADLSAVMDEACPVEIEIARETLRRNSNKHMAWNLLTERIEKHIGFNRDIFESNGFIDEKLTNIVISSTKIGRLISGCLGRVIMWQYDGSVDWISQPVDESMIVTHLSLLEPADDPRPFYYLWVVFQDDSFKMPPLLRMYALLFEQKYYDRDSNLYCNLEAEPCVKFEFELDPKDTIVSLSTIERGINPEHGESDTRKGEDSLLLISTTNTTLLFDLNQWYKEQMPQTLGECKNPNSILACYNMRNRSVGEMGNKIISCAYVPHTLQEFPNNSLSSSEELFYPNSLSLEWIELSLTKLTYWLSRGIQVNLLHEMALAGPVMLTQPSEMFHKCLSVGLIPTNTEVSFSSDHNAQRDMLLSLCLEQRWATFLTKCANEWSDGSASYMYPSFLKWGIQRASTIKMMADRLCVPLFDQSGNNIGESEVKTLRFYYQQLECLSNVVAKLPLETCNLEKQRKALKRVSMYFQVLLWFYDVGLLPETQNLDESSLPISLVLKIPYPFEKLFSIYKEKRESMKDDKLTKENEELLFIDELIRIECPDLKMQWEKEVGEIITNGNYPPPSLQSLLRSYLTDCDQTVSNEFECKHQITIYLLMDLAMLLQGSYPGTDQLIKYPSSFKMSPSLIKLTQALWLLDHEDYHGFLDMITGQLINHSDVKDWHHKLILRTLVRSSQHKLALMYLRIRKPPLSSIGEQSTLVGLSVQHGSVLSAFHRRPQSHYAQLLICFFQACKNYEKLGEILHLALDAKEEETFVKFLDESKSEDIKLLYYLQRCRYLEANCGNMNSCFNTVSSKKIHADVLNAYSLTLPAIVKKFVANTNKTNLDTGLEDRYPRPMSHYKSSQLNMSIYETVIKKAREIFPREENSVIPFITAPCTSLKLNDDRINISCITSPKVVEKSKKRTMDQIMHEEEDGDIRTPERAKRRKVLDDGDAALSAAFSSPLIKRKISSNRDATIETPHSILKIRQLIRNSTPATVDNIQDDVMDSSVQDKERKTNRQIRFSIGHTRNGNSRENVIVEEDLPKVNASEESEEAFYSPTVSDKSLTETAVLSDGSFTCKNIYTARPRPSLRKSYLQLSTESINELGKTSNVKNTDNLCLSASPVSASDNCSAIFTKNIPQRSREQTSVLSMSTHSSTILSPDSSFEINPPARRSTENDLQFPCVIQKKRDIRYNCITSSTPLIKHTNLKALPYTSKESMDIEEEVEEEDIEEISTVETMYINLEEKGIQKSNHFELHESTKKQVVGKSYRNGDLSKSRTSENTSQKYVDSNEEFESLSGVLCDDLSRTENKGDGCLSFGRKVQHKSQEEQSDLKNNEQFDITDDESTNSEYNIVLALDATNTNEEQQSTVSPMHADNVSDTPNITDDESNSSIDIKNVGKNNVSTLNKQENRRNRSTASVKKQLQEESKSNNNNTNYRKTRKSSVTISPDHKQDVNISNLGIESLETTNNVTPRMTRSRRASSITKETRTLNLSQKIPAKAPRSGRASSLAKEVLLASVTVADEGIKRTISSGSEESSGTASPKKSRSRRASSIAKDVPVEAEINEPKTPVRRSSRRSVSVQKETSESVKHLTKNSRVQSVSSLIVEDEEEVTQSNTRSLRIRQSATGGKKLNASLNKSVDEFKASEQNMKELHSVKPTKRRGNSVPKDLISLSRSQKSSSVAKETISEEFETVLNKSRDQHLVEQVVSSPAGNTRSRRSSVQSIPEELDEILSMPSKKVLSASNKNKQTVQNSRQRRASSLDPSQTEIKRRTRSARGKGMLEDVIIEEGTMEDDDQEENSTRKGTKNVPARKRRAASEAPASNVKETTSKGRKTRRALKNGLNEFSFSEPGNADNPPLDQKAIGEVPKYMFSPPHTRSKNAAFNHRE